MSDDDDEDEQLRVGRAAERRRASCRRASAPSRSCCETKEALEEETRILELLNQTGATLASKLDLQSLVQAVTDAAPQLSGAQFGAFFYTVTDADGERVHALHAVGRAARGVREVRPSARDPGVRARRSAARA